MKFYGTGSVPQKMAEYELGRGTAGSLTVKAVSVDGAVGTIKLEYSHSVTAETGETMTRRRTTTARE